MTESRILEDSAQLARQILAICGPGRMLDVGCGTGMLVQELLRQGSDAYGVDVSSVAVTHCNRLTPGHFLVASVLALPYPDDSFDTLISIDCLEDITLENVSRALLEMRRVCRRNVFLRVTTGSEHDGTSQLTVARGWWEDAALGIGFRKHPAYRSVKSFGSPERAGYTIAIPLEKIPSITLVRYPLEYLTAEGALHLDMSRETGSRSDAHMERYTIAAGWVRPGDTVMDCACGFGYGTAMLAALSRGSRFFGVDVEEKAVTYANANFSERYGIEYRKENPEELSFVPDASIDIMVFCATAERAPDFEKVLIEARRVIKPDGRIFISIDTPGEGGTGRDPGRFQVFDYSKIRLALESNAFILEARYAHESSRHPEAKCRLDRLAISPCAYESDAECCIVVASANPFARAETSYFHPDFWHSAVGTDFRVTDFSRYYDNPWLYRPLVQMGERLDDPSALLVLAREVLSRYPSCSSDYGAALSVIGYQLLTEKNSAALDSVMQLELTDVYLEQPSENPHVLRWKISLAYLAALLALKKGDRLNALRYFTVATKFDPCSFSPLLSTKIVAAWFWIGVLLIADGDNDKARSCFAAGVEAGRQALHAPDGNAIGNPLDPLTFGFPELAEVADMAGQCANALHHLGNFDRSPGKFWQMVDLRRFGLASWAMNLEVELKDLRVEINKSRAGLEALRHERSPLARLVNRMLEKSFGVRLVRMRVLKAIGPPNT